MTFSASVSACAKNTVHLSRQVKRKMGGNICGVTSEGSASPSCFSLCSAQSKKDYAGLSISQTISYSSVGGLQTYQGSCFGPALNKPRLTIRSCIGAREYQRRHLEISSACQNTKIRLLAPKQGLLQIMKYNAGPVHWSQGCASVGLICGILVCYSSSKPVYAEAASEKEDGEEDCDFSNERYSHGKKVYTDYSVIGIPGDGRCLFRSVAHGACLRAGKPAPSESVQRELADDLREKVANEFIKRRKETEWFIEGDFDAYVSHIRKPHVWGGEPELLMASHVLQMPITVYMHDKQAGGLISIAEYGQEYGKANPIRVLYHGFGHYDALHFPGYKAGGVSKL